MVEQTLIPGLEPKIKELPSEMKLIVFALWDTLQSDPWFELAGWDPEVHPKLLGFYISYDGEVLPAYQTDNGCFAVNRQRDRLTTFRVDKEKIYSFTS